MAVLLARRERDGLSLRQLAEQSGIPFGTLSWWSWRLRQPDASNSNGGGFVEVVASDQRADSEVVVRLDNGLAVEARAGIDTTWLRDLVMALRSC